jgi:hypothetical protein
MMMVQTATARLIDYQELVRVKGLSSRLFPIQRFLPTSSNASGTAVGFTSVTKAIPERGDYVTRTSAADSRPSMSDHSRRSSKSWLVASRGLEVSAPKARTRPRRLLTTSSSSLGT